MRIDNLIRSHSKQVEPRRDFAFLMDAEVKELDHLLGDSERIESNSQRIDELLQKAEGNVISSWRKQATLTGKDSLKELYNKYISFCDTQGYRHESLFNFKSRLQEFGIKPE